MNSKISLIQDILNFIKKPSFDNIDNKTSIAKKSWLTIRVLSLQLFFVTLAALIVDIILRQIGFTGENQLTEIINTSLISFFILACVIAPIIEEFTFRSWLGSGKLLLSLGSTFVVFFVVSFATNIAYQNSLIPAYFNWLDSLPWYLSLSLNFLELGFYFVIFYFLIFRNELTKKTDRFIKKHFAKLFYTTTILFGLAHISNYIEVKNFFWIMPIVILPQVIGGLGLGYIRVKLGLLFSIIAHSINNLIPFALIALTHSLSDNTRKILESTDTTKNINVEEIPTEDSVILVYMGLYLFALILFILTINIVNLVEYATKKAQKRA